jgi:hypothetical protein
VNWTQIHIPPPPRHIVCVADIVSELRTLAADLTNLCHDEDSNRKVLLLSKG